MQKHIVVCRECGRQFDASKGGYYDKVSRRYTCPKCGRQIKSAEKTAAANARESKTGMRQSMGVMIAKIAVGLVFICAAFATGTAGATITGIIIGLALIAWGLLPYLLPKLEAKKAAEAEAAAIAAEAERRANMPKVCPACGAHTKGMKCEYCGAVLPDED